MIPDPIFATAALMLGAVLGSFLNALTFRYNTGERLWRSMQGRSRCMRCNHTLGAADLVPILSYLYLCGRCRYCSSRISVQYPLVELTAAALSAGIYWQFPTALPYAFWLLVWLTALFLVIYDWRHMILPMGGLVLLSVVGALSLIFSCAGLCQAEVPTYWQIASGPLVALPLFSLSLVSRGRWMGWGDSILALPFGWILGLSQGFTALITAFWAGALVGIALLIISNWHSARGLSLRSEIPFGPFLAFAAALVFFTHIDLFVLLGL